MLTNTIEIDPRLPEQPDPIPQNPPERPVAVSASRYKARLNRWAIARLDEENVHIIARFRSRSDAEGHLTILQRQSPADHFTILAEKYSPEAPPA